MNELHEVIVSLGSNVADKELKVKEALRWLSNVIDDLKVSDVYPTEPLSGQGATYMNAVASGTTRLLSSQLNDLFKGKEVVMGRDSESRASGLVPIDIDIVIYDGVIVRDRDFRCAFFQHGFRQLRHCIWGDFQDAAHE